MGTRNCLVTHIFKNIFFCVQQKKETHTDWEQLDGEETTGFFFFFWGELIL